MKGDERKMTFFRKSRILLTKKLRKRALLWKLNIPKGKYALIADNHGFFDVYKETVLEILDRHPDLKGIFHLGDIIGANSTIDDCIHCLEFTLENHIIAIKGNHCRNLLHCDTRFKYSHRIKDFNKELNELLKLHSDLYDRFYQFPDKIETDYFDLVHCSFYKPYYSYNGFNNEIGLMYNLITKPVFTSHEHQFYMLSKNGIKIKKEDLKFDKDIFVIKPCVISMPTMNYSKEKHKFHHGYAILDVLDHHHLSIHAYHLDKDFINQSARIQDIKRDVKEIMIEDIVWD